MYQPNETCEHCAHAMQMPSQIDPHSLRQAAPLLCRFNPPNATVVVAQQGARQVQLTLTAFPQPLPVWSCSHWQPKPRDDERGPSLSDASNAHKWGGDAA